MFESGSACSLLDVYENHLLVHGHERAAEPLVMLPVFLVSCLPQRQIRVVRCCPQSGQLLPIPHTYHRLVYEMGTKFILQQSLCYSRSSNVMQRDTMFYALNRLEYMCNLVEKYQ